MESNKKAEDVKQLLSPYELQRTPHPLFTDDRRIAVSPRALRPLLMCSICLDILKNTMVTKDCMHRFCSECIITALRSGNKECPNCRMKLISKRSLRQDTNYDEMIAKIYPNREDYREPTRYVSATKEIKSGFAMNENMQRLQADGESKIKLEDEEEDDEENFVDEEMFVNEDDQVDLIAKPMPTIGNADEFLNTRFMKTTKNSLVCHIAEYLRIRFEVDRPGNETSEDETKSEPPKSTTTPAKPPSVNENQSNPSQFILYIVAGPGQYNPLPDNLTLADIQEKYWKLNRPIELYYAYKVSTPPASDSNGSKPNQKSW